MYLHVGTYLFLFEAIIKLTHMQNIIIAKLTTHCIVFLISHLITRY